MPIVFWVLILSIFVRKVSSAFSVEVVIFVTAVVLFFRQSVLFSLLLVSLLDFTIQEKHFLSLRWGWLDLRSLEIARFFKLIECCPGHGWLSLAPSV